MGAAKRIVVDTNRLMAALIRDGTTRELFLFAPYEFIMPEHAHTELQKHKSVLLAKSGLSAGSFDTMLASVTSAISVITEEEVKRHMAKADEIMKDIDPDDAPFIACALAAKADAIWTHDKHFHEQGLIPVISTKDLLDLSRA